MLSPELAKRLRDAGVECQHYSSPCSNCWMDEPGEWDGGCYEPSALSQLLEEVEKRGCEWEMHGYPGPDHPPWYITTLYREDDLGVDYKVYETDLMDAPDTPEDAVALALSEIVEGGQG